MERYKKVMEMADSAASAPYNPETEQQIAGFTPTTMQAFDAVQTNQGIASPYLEYSKAFGLSGASPITGDQISGYMNPYTDKVVDATQRDFDVQNRRQISGVTGGARIGGSLGGDREAVAQALTTEAQSRTQAPIIANLRSQGYSSALSAAQQDAQRQLAASGQFANLGTTAQGAALTDVGQLYQSGGMQQALAQAELDAASGNAAARSAYPFQTAQWLAGLYGAIGPNMGSTTSGTSVTQGPTPNTWSQLAGGAIAAAPYVAKAAPMIMAALAHGGRVPAGFAGGGAVAPYVPRGYVPQASLGGFGGAGLRASPMLAMPAASMSQPSAAQGFESGFKSMSGGLDGLSKIGEGLRTTNGPGGWATTVNPESTTGWSNFMSNMKFAMGGAVPGAPAAASTELAGHMQDIMDAANLMRSRSGVMTQRANGGSVSDDGMPEGSGAVLYVPTPDYRMPQDYAPLPVVQASGSKPSDYAPLPAVPLGPQSSPVLYMPEGSGQFVADPIAGVDSSELRMPEGAGITARYPGEGTNYIPEGSGNVGYTPAAGPAVAGWQTSVVPNVRPVSAGISATPAAPTSAAPPKQGFFEWLASDDAVNMLVPMGLNIMAQGAGGPGSFGLNVGRGAIAGLETYQKGESSRKDRAMKQQEIDQKARQLQMDADRLAMETLKTPYEIARTQSQTNLADTQAAIGKYVPVQPGVALWDALEKKFVGGTGAAGDVSRDLFLREYAKKAADLHAKASEDYASAASTMHTIDDLAALAPFADTGWGAEYMQTARRAAERLGLSYDPQKMSSTDMFRALTQKFVLQEGQKLKPMSNADVTFVEKGLASIQQSPETLKVMLPALKQEAARAARAKEIEMQFLEQGKPPPRAAIEEQVNKEMPSMLRKLFAVEGKSSAPTAAPSPASPPAQPTVSSTRETLMALPDGRHVINGVTYNKVGTKLVPVESGITKSGPAPSAPAKEAAPTGPRAGTRENPHPTRPMSARKGDYFLDNGTLYRAGFWKDERVASPAAP